MPRTNIPSEEEMRDEYEERATQSVDGGLVPVDEPGDPELEWAFGPLENLVTMITHDYEEFLMIDAPGGIGKTHNIKKYLREQSNDWAYQSGYTTPLELYKTLYVGRHKHLFLDDMSGVTKKDKCVNMLKEATDTEGEENIVSWRSSKTPEINGQEIPTSFYFTGSIIMSFNEVPDDRHFDALATRAAGSGCYELDFTYDERIRLLREVAKNDDLRLDYETRHETVEWIEHVTDPSCPPNIRTLEKILNTRAAYEDGIIDEWKLTALEAFDLNYEKHLILELWESEDYGSVEEQRQVFTEETGLGKDAYYDRKTEIIDEKGEEFFAR